MFRDPFLLSKPFLKYNLHLVLQFTSKIKISSSKWRKKEAKFDLFGLQEANLATLYFLTKFFKRTGSRVGRSCACLEPNSYAKRRQNLPKEAKLQFFKRGQINAKKPNFIANSFLIVLGIDTVQLFFYNQCDV